MLWWLTDVARRAGAAMIAGDGTATRLIVEALRRWDETIPIVSEESDVADEDGGPHSSRFWLVDPPDGANAFVPGESDFTVRIALMDGDRPVACVVFVPAADLVYFAGRNLGAWRQIGAQPATRLREEVTPEVGELVSW
jgi:3'(2'), 5'-bisphosphate nucleotidase